MICSISDLDLHLRGGGPSEFWDHGEVCLGHLDDPLRDFPEEFLGRAVQVDTCDVYGVGDCLLLLSGQPPVLLTLVDFLLPYGWQGEGERMLDHLPAATGVVLRGVREADNVHGFGEGARRAPDALGDPLCLDRLALVCVQPVPTPLVGCLDLEHPRGKPPDLLLLDVGDHCGLGMDLGCDGALELSLDGPNHLREEQGCHLGVVRGGVGVDCDGVLSSRDGLLRAVCPYYLGGGISWDRKREVFPHVLLVPMCFGP